MARNKHPKWPVVKSLVVCDKAERDPTLGLWDLHRTWPQQVMLKDFPAEYFLSFYIEVMARFFTEVGQVTFVISNDKGADLMREESGEIPFTGMDTQAASVVFNAGFRFTQPDSLTMTVFWNDSLIATYPLFIMQIVASGQPEQN
jgi:hypothetical protein